MSENAALPRPGTFPAYVFCTDCHKQACDFHRVKQSGNKHEWEEIPENLKTVANCWWCLNNG